MCKTNAFQELLLFFISYHNEFDFIAKPNLKMNVIEVILILNTVMQ